MRQFQLKIIHANAPSQQFIQIKQKKSSSIIYPFFQLRDLHLGTQFPTIKGLEVADSKIDPDTGLLETLDLSLDLHYSGNFQMSIDVKMLLGKTAYLALQGKLKKFPKIQ